MQEHKPPESRSAAHVRELTEEQWLQEEQQRFQQELVPEVLSEVDQTLVNFWSRLLSQVLRQGVTVDQLESLLQRYQNFNGGVSGTISSSI